MQPSFPVVRFRSFGPPCLGALLVLVGLAASSASAGGVGGSFSYTRSETRLKDVDDVWADLDTHSDIAGFGVVFDTNLAQDRLFNYRLNASIQFVDQEVEQQGVGNSVEGTSLALDQTFGFGIVRTPEFRLFVGPSIHLGVGGMDDEIDVGGFEDDYDQTTFTAGIGPELGMNFNLGSHLTLSFSTFARYGVQVQSFDDFFDDLGSDGDFVGDEVRVGAVASVFFRFGRDAWYGYDERPRSRDYDRY